MSNRLKKTLQEIKDLSQTHHGRTAFYIGGAIVAGGYFGYVGPEALEAMFSGALIFSTANPTFTIADIASTMFHGAETGSAAMIQHLTDAIGVEGSELTHSCRETLQASRDILSRYSERGGAFLREFFASAESSIGECYTAISEAVSQFTQKDQLKDTVRNIFGHAAAVGAGIWGLLRIGKEAFEFFETGKKIFDKTNDKDNSEKHIIKVEKQYIKINIQTDKAPEKAATPSAWDAEERINISNSDDIIWMSDDFIKSNRGSSENLKAGQETSISDPELLEDKRSCQLLPPIRRLEGACLKEGGSF